MSSPPSTTAEKLVKRMSSGPNLSDQVSSNATPKDDKVLKMATFSLQKYLKEPDFASEFLERGGLESLCEIIKKASGNTLAYALNSFASLMEHNAGWDSLSEDFVVEIAHIVVNETLVTIGRPATAILIKIVTANDLPSTTTAPATTAAGKSATETETVSGDLERKKTAFGYPTLQKAIECEPQLLPTLIQRLQSQDYTLCLNSLELLTAMLKTVTEEHQSELPERLEQLDIKRYIVRLMNNQPSEELRERLLEYQTALIQNVIQRKETPVSLHNSKDMKMLNDMWNAAKVANIQVPGARKWKKIGFSSESPQREFVRTGKFGLQRMHAFVMGNQDLFSKMLLEQIHRPEHKRCLFAKTSCESTELLFSQWDITSGYIAADLEPISMYFDRVQAATIRMFFRLFQDMKATNADFSKVSALVRSQLRAVFKNDGVKDISEFERVMEGTPYQVIRDRRLKELEWADDLLGREAIRNLRSRLNKQSYDFIKKQRISCLLQGAWFPNPLMSQRSSSITAQTGNMTANELLTSVAASNSSNSGGGGGGGGVSNIGGAGGAGGAGSSNKRWRYYKLSPSKKALQFGDFTERIAPIIKDYDKLPNKIDLSNVHEIRTIRKPSNAGVMALFPLPPATSPILPMSPSGFGSHHFTTSANAYHPHDVLTGNTITGTSTVSSSSSSTSAALAFALYNENQTSLAEFICASSEQASEWKDGFSMLLDKGITSKETAEYLHSLTEIGVKVKLLQIAGDRVEVPHGSLEIPPIPYGSASKFYYDV